MISNKLQIQFKYKTVIIKTEDKNAAKRIGKHLQCLKPVVVDNKGSQIKMQSAFDKVSNLVKELRH